ncbi:tetratricopeptide repeat protein [Pusillimonas sp. MFBS29]|uniref:YfgM family protein n=1 Tax=Pusillimonas sp. MFBS29 TaxID=2886690 RepID=UPI001D0FD1DD|nr:tetratricopeptide repeat protein [Pusillimonas sp. MFBS29]MCC2595334.1 tetratricopeptide repeat protein [Pusillimonas sp. MFBS29]
MAYDLEEQEKLDALRAWWDRYGTLLVVLSFIIAAGIVGWRGWQWYQGHTASQAMGYYEALEGAAGQSGDDALARIKAASSTLREDFTKSGYTPRGVLIAAQALEERDDLDGAREQLEWLVGNSSDPSLVPLAKLRLAGVLLEQKQYDQALAQVSDAPPAFAGLYADRRGDILLAQGKIPEAKAAWEQALKEFGAAPITQIVQLKLDALGGA